MFATKIIIHQGFCEVKKFQKSEVGGSSPNSDFFFLGNVVFLLCVVLFVLLLYMFSKKWIGGWVGGWSD